ncbi:AbrB family transcriptional regulator [archaeon]|nr:MAG: AbrB family transcriptional regulator [archaeon]
MTRIRVGKRGVIVIPADVRRKLGIEDGMTLELEVKHNALILKVRDLWIDLRKRGKKLKVDIEEAEREADEEEELWLKRVE